MSNLINFAMLITTITALALSLMIWWRSFRPIVTAMVTTHASGSDSTAYNLVILNSGIIPAQKISLHILDRAQLEKAINPNASKAHREKWLACFEPTVKIELLQNGAQVSCSFGTSAKSDGFWNYGENFPIMIRYRGYFGTEYQWVQDLQIVESGSFTGHMWGPPRTR